MVTLVEMPDAEDEDICDWAERNIVIPSTEARPGPLRLARYQREILQSFQDPSTQQITLQCSSQSGKTLDMQIMLGYTMAVKPGPIMLGSISDEDNKDFLSTKFEPMVESSDVIRNVLLTKKGQSGTFPVGRITYIGGYVVLAHSGAPRSLRGKSCRVVFGDEVDYWKSSKDAKNPVNMLKQRTTSFGLTSKVVVLSTPVEEGESIIEDEFERGDQRRFHTSCIFCGFEEVLTWDKNVHIDVENQKGMLFCSSCGAEIRERDRIRMIDTGRWIPSKPFRGHASFHLSQLSSAMTTFANTVKSFFEFDSQAFTTQCLAETYSTKLIEELQVSELERFGVEDPGKGTPDAIIVGVDRQKNRFEYSVVHSYPDDEFWVAEHTVVPIRMDDEDAAWQEISDNLRPIFPDMLYMDVGYLPDDTKDGMEKHLRWLVRRERAIPIRGRTAPSFGELLNWGKRQEIQWVSVDEAKVVFRDLIDEEKFTFNPKKVGVDYLDQLASEKLIEELSRTGRQEEEVG